MLHERVLPSGRKVCRARYVDPDTGRKRDVTLDAFARGANFHLRDCARDVRIQAGGGDSRSLCPLTG